MKRRLIRFLLDLIRHRSGRVFEWLRVKLYLFLGMKMGNDVFIAAGVYIEYPEKMQVGDHVSIQHHCFISCYGGLEIGSDVSIAHGASIITSTHPLHGRGAIRERPLEASAVKIGDDVWIGMKASIMMGVEIGSGTVVGAHSLVNKSLSPRLIVAGAPARELRRR